MLDPVTAAIAVLAAERTLSRLADKVHDKVLDAAASELVERVVQSQDEQTRLLRSIEGDVRALVEGPYHAGIDLLRLAARPGLTTNQRAGELVKARDRFVDAHAIERGNPPRLSLIEYHLGLAHVALDDWREAEHRFEQAYVSALTATHRLVELGWRSRSNGADRVLPLLEQVRSARRALGASDETLPAFALASDGPYALAWRPNGAADEVAAYLALYPTVTLAALAAGTDEETGSPGREVTEALAFAIGPEALRRPDETMGVYMRAQMGLPPEQRPQAARYGATAAEVAAGRRAGWPPRHLSRLPLGEPGAEDGASQRLARGDA